VRISKSSGLFVLVFKSPYEVGLVGFFFLTRWRRAKGITCSFISPLSYQKRDRERSLSRENLQKEQF